MSSRRSGAKPRSVSSSITLALFRMRMTTRSPIPWPTGMVETRMSMSFAPILNPMRPSCGRRFSAMFSPLMILMRATMLGSTDLGAVRTW